MTSPDVVVVGGGAIGASVAWRAAGRGLSVTLVDDPSEPGASRIAAGMLAPVTEAEYGEEHLLRLNLASSDAYPAFVAALEDVTGLSVGYRRCGTLMVARDNDDNAALEDIFRFQRSLGLEVTRLKGREARELEPGLTPRARGGILVEGDHQIDPRALVEALGAACKRAGVMMHEGRVQEVLVQDQTARGVRLGTGEELSAGAVVVCAGVWSGGIQGIPPRVMPSIRPVKGQLVQLRGDPSDLIAERTVRGLDAYVVARADGRVVVGATVEEQGFDLRTTAGAVHELLRAAYELLPGIVELEFVEARAGLRPGTPDNSPAIGATSVPGLLIASGHYRNGVLLAPITADAVAEILATGETPDFVAPFSPRRFAEALR